MKRFMVLVIGLVFLFTTSAIAADTKAAASADPVKKVDTKAKKTEKKAADMSTTGKVLEVSDKVLKIERTLKGKAETMEFSLEKSITGIKMGDRVKVSYLVKDGRNILTKVAPAKKTAAKKAKKAKKTEKKDEKKADAPAPKK